MNTFRSAALISAFTLCIAPSAFAQSRVGEAFIGKVTGIKDGDTITVLNGKIESTIRLHGVDAPEFRQPFGAKSKQHLSNTIYRKEVKVVRKQNGTDRSGRIIADVFAGGKSICELMVRDGFAWWYERYAPNAANLKRFQAEAKRAKRGLWQDPNPTAPWKFRPPTKSRASWLSPELDNNLNPLVALVHRS